MLAAQADANNEKTLLSRGDIERLLTDIVSGSKNPSDKFFDNGNKLLLLQFQKRGVVSVDDYDNLADAVPSVSHKNMQSFLCSAPGCGVMHKSIADYEMHYNSAHRYACTHCKHVLPTSHLLGLHVQEQHDTYFQTLVEHGHKMYECYLEECKEKFLTPQERKEHSIFKHKFPSNFRYEKKTKKEQKLPIANVVKPLKEFTFGHCKERTFNTQVASSNKALENVDTLKAALDDIDCNEM